MQIRFLRARTNVSLTLVTVLLNTLNIIVCSDNEESGVGGGGTGEKQNLWLKFLSASVCDKNLKEVELFHLKKKTVK